MAERVNKTVEDQKKMEKEDPKVKALEREILLLKEQLSKRSDDQEAIALQKEAERLAQEEATLKEEADLRKTLGEEFSSVKQGLKAGEEISPEQIVTIMADAVGASSDAQSKLILSQVNQLLKERDVELKKTQKLMMELAAGISMSQARSDNPDFDDYKDDITKIMSTTRGLSPEDALLLAKARKSRNQPSQRETETEKPGSPPSRGSLDSSSRDLYVQEREEGDDAQLSPRAVFRKAADAAIARTLANRQK